MSHPVSSSRQRSEIADDDEMEKEKMKKRNYIGDTFGEGSELDGVSRKIQSDKILTFFIYQNFL